MRNLMYYLVMTFLLIGCQTQQSIKGNWGYCENGKYNEIYIGDSTFMFYIMDFGFLSPFMYDFKNLNSINLYNTDSLLEMRVNVSCLKSNSMQLELVPAYTEDKKVLYLIRISDSIPSCTSKNIDEFYTWLNTVFLPDYNIRSQIHHCQHDE